VSNGWDDEYDIKLFKHVGYMWLDDYKMFSKSKLKFSATNKILFPPEEILQRTLLKILMN